MKVNPNIAISESGFLFNPSTGESFKVNNTGVELLGYMQEGLSDEEILQKIQENYEVDEKEASRDLLDFRNLLNHYHLMNKDE